MLFCKTVFLIKGVYCTEPSLEARVPWIKQLQSLFYLQPEHRAASSKDRHIGAYSIGLTIMRKFGCPRG